ncbi:flagellin, partial [Vibrio parahaemolyticus]
MSKTAEGAMNEIQTLIGNMNSLAVAAANSAVVDAATLQADQTQIQSSIESINRIASTTQFGNKFLLNGSAGIS